MKREPACALRLPKKPLSNRQLKFIEQYCIDCNGAAAAVRAGYSKGCAKVTAVRLLADPRIKALVEEGKAQLSRKTSLTKEWLANQVRTSFEQAVVSKHHAAVGRLGELLARMHGWTIENRNLRVINSVRDLSTSELETLIAEAGSGS